MIIPRDRQHAQEMLSQVEKNLQARHHSAQQHGETELWHLVNVLFDCPDCLTTRLYQRLLDAARVADPSGGETCVAMAWIWVAPTADGDTARHHDTFLQTWFAQDRVEHDTREAWNRWLALGADQQFDGCQSLQRQWLMADTLARHGQVDTVLGVLRMIPFEQREGVLHSMVGALRLRQTTQDTPLTAAKPRL